MTRRQAARMFRYAWKVADQERKAAIPFFLESYEKHYAVSIQWRMAALAWAEIVAELKEVRS